MKYLVLITLLFSACGTLKHKQEEDVRDFFATSKTYEQVVMRLGLPAREKETEHTRICTWIRSEGASVVPLTIGAVNHNEWRLTVMFSKVSGRITDWRFISY